MGPPPPSVVYSLENFGEITNRGWGISLVASHSRFSLSAAWSQVDSRVRRLAPRYGGDLEPSDRMLEVPPNTMSLTARCRAGPWSSAVSVARAEDWINYDRLRIATDCAAGGPRRDFVGQRLRAYWKQYDGVTRLRLTLVRELGSHLTLTATGENLLDEQRGEPDNITVVPGRSVRVGLSGAW